jgi:hypothetical protein
MKIKLSGWGLGLAAALIVQLAGQGSLAADYYWGGGKVDLANGTPIPMGTNEPNGVWDATIKNWATDRSGTTYVAWPNTGSDTAWFNNLSLVSYSALPVITQTVDMTVGRIVAIITNTSGNCYGSGYRITATNTRTITLAGNAPEIDVSTGPAANASENTRYIEFASNIRLAGTKGFTRGGYYGGRVQINGDCSGLSGVVKCIDGGSPSSYASIILNANTANLRNISLFDIRVGGFAVQCGTGINDQIGDSAVIRLAGREGDGLGSGALSFSPSGFDYRCNNALSSETISQIVLDAFGTLVFQYGGATTRGTLSLGHATAGLSRGPDGKGTALVKAAGAIGSEVLHTDVVISNGISAGVTIPWMATTECSPVKLNAATRKLQLVPFTGAPTDLTTWGGGANYVVTNSTFTPSGAIPNGAQIDTLGICGPTTAIVLPIGSASTDTLTVNSGMIAFSSKNGDVVITNGCLTSGTNELNLIVGDSAANGTMKIYSRITGSLSLTKGGARNVQLYGSNTYSGVTYVNNAMLEANAANAIPGDLVIGAGGRFQSSVSSALKTNAAITIREGGRFYQSTSSQNFGVMTLENGGYEFRQGGTITFNSPGAGIVFSNGGSFTQTDFNASAPFNVLTDVEYAPASSNQAIFATLNRTNLVQFMDLTAGATATRTFNVSNSIALASTIPEMDIDIPLRTASGYPATLVKTGDGALELTGVSGVFSGSGIISNGTLLLNAYAPATNLACTITSGSAVVSGLASTNWVKLGQLLATNAAMSTGRYIKSMDSSSQITLSGSAAASTNVLSLLACSALGTSSVTVVGGTLAGTGGVGGDVTVKSGGTLAPGITTNTVATFNVGRNLLVESGGILSVDLTASTNDVIAVVGTANITGATLAVNGPKPVAGQTLTILTATSVAGTFATVPDGYSVKTVGNTLQLSRAAAGFVFSVE